MKPEGQVRIPSGCAIAAVISKDGKRMTGRKIIDAMKPMHDRSNGLGGGFAAYGIYPEYKDFYALHMFYDERATRKNCEVFLKERFEIVKSEIIPTRQMIGSSVMAGILRVGMISDFTISKRSFKKASQFFRVARSS